MAPAHKLEYVGPADDLDVMREQFAYLAWHHSVCTRTECLECDRYHELREVLVGPMER